jgi:hypothetical protein
LAAARAASSAVETAANLAVRTERALADWTVDWKAAEKAAGKVENSAAKWTASSAHDSERY